MVLLLHICRNSVFRLNMSKGAHGLHLLDSVTGGEDVNGTAKFCVPCAVILEQFAINSSRQQFVSENVVQGAAKDVPLMVVMDNNEHRHCWDVL